MNGGCRQNLKKTNNKPNHSPPFLSYAKSRMSVSLIDFRDDLDKGMEEPVRKDNPLINDSVENMRKELPLSNG